MRIAPAARRSVAGRAAAVAGRTQGREPLQLFLALGRRPGLFAGWLIFAARLMPRGRLPRRETELVILRTAHLRDCAYEFEHHVRIGQRIGLTADDVERVRTAPHTAGWSARETALLQATDALVRDRDLDDVQWRELRAQLAEAEVVELLMLTGHYDMLATLIGTLRIAPDAPRPACG